MIRATLAATVVVLWTMAGAPAFAEVPQAARTAFADGKFIAAADLAESEGSAEALAFAARARTADAITREKMCLACLTKAQATAQKAIARDPNQAEGYVELALAIGFRGRLLSTLDAQSESLAEKGRAAVDRALKLEPKNTWARASLGGWHLEIVHRAGPVLASVLYGANEQDGLRNFRAALTADPDLLLRYHYALAILALDARRFRSEALKTLEIGLRDKRSDALLTFTRKRAEKLVDTLKTESPNEIDALVRRYQGYPD